MQSTELPEQRLPPVATFSIVAFDPDTGELGVAVQSKFIAVGAVVLVHLAGGRALKYGIETVGGNTLKVKVALYR